MIRVNTAIAIISSAIVNPRWPGRGEVSSQTRVWKSLIARWLLALVFI
jgi:hypothetical protein